MLQRCAPRRRARRASVGAVLAAVLGAAVLEEGRWRAGGGVGEAGGKAVGEAQAESLVGDAGEAVVGVVGESGVAGESGMGTPGTMVWCTAAAC